MKPKIGVVGGTGKIGLLFANFFKRKGHDVAISGYDIKKAKRIARKHGLVGMDNEELAKSCDVTFFSVPIEKTVEIIKEIAPLAKPGSLLSDFTSIKAAPINAMLKYSRKDINVIGLHPLFGPNVGLKGQKIVFIPARGRRYVSWLRKVFSEEGIKLTQISAKEHDKMMGFVQALTHFSAIATAFTMKKMKFDFRKSISLATPVYKNEIKIMKRIFLQDPRLYSGIQMFNPNAKIAIKNFISSSKELQKIIEKKDTRAFVDFFSKGKIMQKR